MNDATQWLNTLLLLFILWFQWNRNKILSERIDQQTNLIKDTKSVVTQQATALESQAKVVETAVRYSEAFDPAKMEAVLRKQVEIESLEKITNFEKQYQQELIEKDEKHKQQLKELVNSIVQITVNIIKTNFYPLMKLFIGLMVRVSSKERDELIAAVPTDNLFKNLLEQASVMINEEYNTALVQCLIGEQPQQQHPPDRP